MKCRSSLLPRIDKYTVRSVYYKYMATSPNARLKILQTAVEIISKEGISKLSFDRLVKVAGISKGGILYHFATKEALLSAVTEYIEQVFIENYKAMLDNQPPHPGRALLAYLKSALEGRLGKDPYAALVAITIERPVLLHESKSMYRVLRRDMQADGGDFIRQWTLVAAFDGLWIDYNTNLYGLKKAEHAAFGTFMLDEACKIIEEGKRNK